MLTLHQLKVFDAAAKRLNLSEAARTLSVSQTAVSHAIKKLEILLKKKLIKKIRTGVELTKTGESFRTGVAKILFDLNDLIRKHSTKETHRSGEILTIGASHGPSSHLVPSLLTSFQRKFPLVHIIQRTGTSAEIEELLLKGSVEVAFISNPSNRPGLTMEPFAAERLLLVVARTHPNAKKHTIDVAQLPATRLLVGAGKDGRNTTTKVLRRKLGTEIHVNVAMQFDSPDALKAAVLSGAGVGILYQDMVTEELKNGSLTILTPVGFYLEGRSYLGFLKDRTLAPVTTELLEFVREHGESITRESERATPRSKRSSRARRKSAVVK